VAKKDREVTKEQKVKEQIIDAIRTLTHYKKYTLGQIEKMLAIPQNTLSAMLNGRRNMSPKYQRLLSEFIKALSSEDKTVTFKIGDIGPLPEAEPSEVEPLRAAVDPPAPPAVATAVAAAPQIEKLPPSGLSKTELQRWYRENQILK
jgi:transcriptional regulator with XRE-family HTH domain